MQLVQKDGSDAQSTVEHIHFHCIPFDAPDLCKWNYRKLHYTPLENVTLYKKARKKIVELDVKFEQKYTAPAGLPVVCDLLIVNEHNEILMQERAEGQKLSPDYLTLPGGGVTDFSRSFEAELAREVEEEIGLKIKPADVLLFSSTISSIKRQRTDTHLNVKYALPDQFVWNTYLLKNYRPTMTFTPGDDCAEVVWMPIKAADKNPRFSPGMRELMKKLQHELK
jgi:ADP-ribose pyrophosphatase YjhB (NUDIX family)